MKFASFLTPIACYATMLFVNFLPISTVVHHIIFFGALIISLIWCIIISIKDKFDLVEKLQIRLEWIGDELMSYHILNHSDRLVTVKKIYTANSHRSQIWDIPDLGLPPELRNLPMSFSDIACGASLSGQFDVNPHSYYFYVQLNNGKMFFKRIKR